MAKKEAEFKVLLGKREHVFASVNLIYDMAKGVRSGKTSVTSFLVRAKHLDTLKAEFYDQTEKISLLALSLRPEENSDFKALTAFDELYYGILEVVEKVQSESKISDAASSAVDGDQKVNVRLPKIDLPKFDGNLENWPIFIDTFFPLIHKNKSLSDIERFHYLVSCLSGPALSIAKNVPLSSANYTVVFDALRERYDNKRVLATSYLDRIMRLKPMSSASYDELSRITGTLRECVNALTAMKIGNLSEFLLFYFASRSVDSATMQKFEELSGISSLELPSFDQLIDFLKDQLRISEINKMSHTPTPPKQVTKRSFVVSSDAKPATCNLCPCCKLQHSIYKCTKLNSMDVQSRRKLVAELKLCFNCLRSGHSAGSCYSKTNCLTCGKRHNTFLHYSEPPSSTVDRATFSGSSSYKSDDPISSLACVNPAVSLCASSKRVVKLLGSAVVRLQNKQGSTFKVRALIDSCSHECIMTTACAKRVGLRPTPTCESLSGIGAAEVNEISGVTACRVLPRDNNDPKFDLEFIVMPAITTDIPAEEVPTNVSECYQDIYLADPDFEKPGQIDILLGVDVFDKVYDGRRYEPGPGLPTALHSIYGWVITGKASIHSEKRERSTLLVTSNLDQIIQRFWEVEEPPSVHTSHPDDDVCEALYTKHVYREADGRYVVPILAKENEELGDSYHRSLNRFHNMEKRLARDPGLKTGYADFMKEYEDLGHMQPIATSDSKAYIIPHHCVVRPSSVTTKLRVVFDASCKTTNNKSLNDVVYIGPKLQVDVVDIITKFRLHSVVFTADICKMYRQINIIPENRSYQHILWRESNDKPIQEYELKTITYGVSSSPFLAIRTLRQLAKDHGDQYPRAAEVLCEETFMDDITTGAASQEDAVQLRKDVVDLLQLGQFELRKWSSNNLNVLKEIPEEHCQMPKSFEDKSSVKVLGIKWDPGADHFSYVFSEADFSPTKRKILSIIARMYDPLGWIAPVVFAAKVFMQELWQLKVSWDEPLPEAVQRKWQKFAEQLKSLEKITLSRHAISNESQQIHLVGFCDGSSKGYGCCVYLVSQTLFQTQSILLIGKSKVAPLKSLTVNRLELCGAVLLTKVMKHMYDLLKRKIKIDSVVTFTDSTTVLAWINTEPCKLKVYVANRVVRIRDSCEISSWRHVSTQDNPADCCSRGTSVNELAVHHLWWHGPAWLQSHCDDWPKSYNNIPMKDLPEVKPEIETGSSLLVTTSQDFISSFMERFSSFSKMQRTLAWIRRFSSNAKKIASERNFLSLSLKELKDSHSFLIKEVQNLHFSEIFLNIQKGLNCVKSIQKLQPFIDSSGLLRVGGRLRNSNLSQEAKHPLLLPKCHLSNVIIESLHKSYLHIGPRALQSLLARQYWILGIRSAIRSRLSKCVTCFKARPISSSTVMGDLPSVRIQPARCFEAVGIDFGGPFFLKESKRRNARTYKAYICLFVCLATKAIHLEVVTELSTEAFIAALDRFVARRGLCKRILSDNGTNFVGAKRYLNEMFHLVSSNQTQIADHLTTRSISWDFNPPGAPHFGGIFESGIRSTKYHLKRVVGAQTLTLEEMSTVLTKVEAMLNSRPLCVLSTSPAECDVLTPGHFLIGRPLVGLPEADFDDSAISPRTRWQLLQKMTQSFWHIWRRDYLHTLQQRTKWSNSNVNFKVGDVVLVNEPNLKNLHWKLGRITETYPGKDNVVRVALVKTSSGLLKRPIVKLCLVPTE